MSKFTRFTVSILTVLCLILGTVSLWQANSKIISTGITLGLINMDTSDYNTSYIKTDAMTEEQEERDAIRQEYYNSDDTVVRVYSNSWGIVKILVWIAAIASYPLTILMWVLHIYRFCYRQYRRAEKRRNRQTMRKWENGSIHVA